MTVLFQSHGGKEKSEGVPGLSLSPAARPAGADIAVDEQADFGYLIPPLDAPENYLPETGETLGELDELGNLMIDQTASETSETDSTLPPVLTYWGQFLDHELTARTDRESLITSVSDAHPPQSSSVVEAQLRNARTPRFDLDSVYGGIPTGEGLSADVATVISGMRHPTQINKMRVGTAIEPGPLPDNLDEHRDLPRYSQVQDSVRQAALRLAEASMSNEDFTAFEATLPLRALIGDQRNDENLIVAQFHLSFLRFHNKAVDFLASHDTGWIADFHSAQLLTRLHYQWLIVEGYLKGVCQPAVVSKIIDSRASHFFKFRAEYDARQPAVRLGNALPLEFSAAAYRFGHSMVRAAYDHNRTFGRPNDPAAFDLLFTFTGGGGMFGSAKLPKNWVIDWTRFVVANPPKINDGLAERVARKIDTELAPPLGVMQKEGNNLPPGQLQDLFKHLARRNLRRGYNLRLPTGQAVHRYLRQHGAITSAPIEDVSTIFAAKPNMRDFLTNSGAKFHERTPLWFYCLAEAEQGGGGSLGEVGSWIVASTIIGVLLSDPDSALSRDFTPSQSPLRMHDDSPIDSIAKWMKFAVVME